MSPKRKPKLVFTTHVKIFVIDTEKTKYHGTTHALVKKVYKIAPLILRAQYKSKKFESIAMYNQNFIKDTSGHFMVYTSDIYDDEGNRLVNIGDFISELLGKYHTFPINAYIKQLQPCAVYNSPYWTKLVMDDAETSVPKDEDGSSLKTKPKRVNNTVPTFSP